MLSVGARNVVLTIDAEQTYPHGSGSTIEEYSSVMGGHETFSVTGDETVKVCFLDGNGSSRNFNPSGVFPAGYHVQLVNVGGEDIIFDSGTLASTISAGDLGMFFYDGTIWY